MLLLDKPYLSDFLIDTIRRNNFPVLSNAFSQNGKFDLKLNLLAENEAIAQLLEAAHPKLYTSSENSIGWIADKLKSTDLPEKINLFKDKVKFRDLTASLYPDFFYKKIELVDLKSISIDKFPFPFIIKPAIGFFSMGVYKVSNISEWEGVKQKIAQEIESVKGLYPNEVLDINSFIIEECIEGDEFAFDAYFDEHGNPVLLNSFKHLFASSTDVSDRVYYTSNEIIKSNYANFLQLLNDIGSLTNVRNFPMHVEVRKTKAGRIVPIEVNPMRFGGWCTTADITNYAFGINPYKCFFYSKKPDWETIVKSNEDKVYSIVVLDNSSGINAAEIESFNYELLVSHFSTPLELRKVDYNEYPVFGFLYVETNSETFSELERILTSNLREYIIKKN